MASQNSLSAALQATGYPTPILSTTTLSATKLFLAQHQATSNKRKSYTVQDEIKMLDYLWPLYKEERQHDSTIKGATQDLVGKHFHKSGQYARQLKTIHEYGNKALLDAIISGRIKVSTAYDICNTFKDDTEKVTEIASLKSSSKISRILACSKVPSFIIEPALINTSGSCIIEGSNIKIFLSFLRPIRKVADVIIVNNNTINQVNISTNINYLASTKPFVNSGQLDLRYAGDVGLDPLGNGIFEDQKILEIFNDKNQPNLYYFKGDHFIASSDFNEEKYNIPASINAIFWDDINDLKPICSFDLSEFSPKIKRCLVKVGLNKLEFHLKNNLVQPIVVTNSCDYDCPDTVEFTPIQNTTKSTEINEKLAIDSEILLLCNCESAIVSCELYLTAGQYYVKWHFCIDSTPLVALEKVKVASDETDTLGEIMKCLS